MMNFKNLRREYLSRPLHLKNLNPNPMEQLRIWIKDAIDANVIEPNAMVLATADSQGRPSSRTILLKEIDEAGLIFYTNYESRKARELDENPFASFTFYWKELERQLTIDGRVEKISEEHSKTYFSTRPRESQLGAWSSKQGTIIPSREILDKTFEYYKKEFAGKEVPKPVFWGGYRLIPDRWIFWQGRENRLHDRFLYLREHNDEWRIERLSP